MVSTSARTLIANALRLINVLAAGESANANDQEDSFHRLNSLIDSWGTQPLTMQVDGRMTLQLVANQQVYTIGQSGGADFALPRPTTVTALTMILPGSGPPDIEVPLAELSMAAYQGLQMKSMPNALVTQWFYEPTSPDGTLYVWPLPDQDLQVVLYYPTLVTQFPDLTTVVTLPPGYERALRYNLAIELAPEFGVLQLHPLVMQHAVESLADLKQQNVVLSDLGLDLALTGCRVPYNIYTDQ